LSSLSLCACLLQTGFKITKTKAKILPALCPSL
jgi:hypothetical protein